MQTLIRTSSRSFLLAPSSLRSSPHPHLLLSFCSPFSSSSRRTDSLRQQNLCVEESKAIKVSVWWDYENCAIPSGVNAYRVAHRIISALRSSGIRGPVSINAFGDVAQMNRSTQEALICTGVCLTHVPNCGKNSADRLLMADMISWITQNPPPHHFFLISSDTDFTTILHRLRMNNYNILLSSANYRKSSLCSAATFMWPWIPLVKGEDFTPRHFNYPPDGGYGSWYGYQKGALDNPFFAAEQRTPYSQQEESMEGIAEVKSRVIPRSVVNGIHQILLLHPEGISLSRIRDSLKRRNILDNELFGFKNFSSLISSLTNVMLLPPSNGENVPIAVLRRKRSIKLADEQVEEPSVQISAEPAKPAEEEQEKSSETIQMIEPLAGPVKPAEPPEPSVELNTEKIDQVDDLDKGTFRWFRKVFFGSSKNSEEPVPVVVTCEKGSSTSLPVSVPVEKEKLAKTDREDETKEKDGVIDRRLFRRIWRYFGFGKEKRGSNLFADPKFWNDVESFLMNPDGSDLVAKSRTREELVQGLHKADILSLKSLDSGRLLQLIDLIISEKKWIQESTSSIFPFTLSIPSASTSSTTTPESLPESITNTDQLPIIKSPPKEEVLSDCHKLVKELLDKQPEGFEMCTFKSTFERNFGYILEYRRLGHKKLSSLLQTLPGIKIDIGANIVYKDDEKEERNKDDNIGKDEAGSNEELYASAPKEKVLSDCYKLVKEMLNQQPDGFDMSVFKSAFERKFGYMLEHRKHGHLKLSSLLQTLPGLRVDVTANKVYYDEEESNEVDKVGEDEADSNEEDSVFDELGPVSKEVDFGYHEPSLSDDEFSDESDTEVSPVLGRGTTEDNSSLVKILDCFSGSKDGCATREEPLGHGGFVNCSRDNNNRSNLWLLADKVREPRYSRTRKGRFNFVSDEGRNDKEIVDNILTTLKKHEDGI